MNTVDVNTVFVVREAKHERDTRRYMVSVHYSNSSTQYLSVLSKASYYGQQVIICSRDYDVTVGGANHKASTYVELTASCVLRNQPENQRK